MTHTFTYKVSVRTNYMNQSFKKLPELKKTAQEIAIIHMNLLN